jgi:hypothetical protein
VFIRISLMCVFNHGPIGGHPSELQYPEEEEPEYLES